MTLSRKKQRRREKAAKLRMWLRKPAALLGMTTTVALVTALVASRVMEESGKTVVTVLYVVALLSFVAMVAIVTRWDRRSPIK
jgi:L-asparagine transporter-like permease